LQAHPGHCRERRKRLSSRKTVVLLSADLFHDKDDAHMM